MVADRGVGKRTEVVSLYRSFVWTRNYFDQRILELLCFLSTTSHFSGFLFISWQSLSAQGAGLMSTVKLVWWILILSGYSSISVRCREGCARSIFMRFLGFLGLTS